MKIVIALHLWHNISNNEHGQGSLFNRQVKAAKCVQFPRNMGKTVFLSQRKVKSRWKTHEIFTNHFSEKKTYMGKKANKWLGKYEDTIELP